MKTFPSNDYQKAVNYARETATATNQEMLLKKSKEFGRAVYVVAFASRYDADYYRSEIIKPGEPFNKDAA